jgi:hypothetical protein
VKEYSAALPLFERALNMFKNGLGGMDQAIGPARPQPRCALLPARDFFWSAGGGRRFCDRPNVPSARALERNVCQDHPTINRWLENDAGLLLRRIAVCKPGSWGNGPRPWADAKCSGGLRVDVQAPGYTSLRFVRTLNLLDPVGQMPACSCRPNWLW